MSREELDRWLAKKMREFDVMIGRVPPAKESPDTHKALAFTVKNPRPTQPTSPSNSSDTQAGD